jgi:hypothetical protein
MRGGIPLSIADRREPHHDQSPAFLAARGDPAANFFSFSTGQSQNGVLLKGEWRT